MTSPGNVKNGNSITEVAQASHQTHECGAILRESWGRGTEDN